VVDLPDEILPLYRLFLGFLLHRPGVRVDLQMVLNHLPSDPGHLRRLPGKHIYISPKEGDECEFLFAVQAAHDVGGLGGIRPDLDGLDGNVLVAGVLHTGC
jgi:hypothetical protein